MPSQTSDNRFGSLKWVVHPVAGQGTHTTMQAAITDAGNFAASSGIDSVTIGWYPAQYSEELTFPNEIDYHILGLGVPPPHQLFMAGTAPDDVVEWIGKFNVGTTPGRITFERVLWHLFNSFTLYNPTTANVVDFIDGSLDQALGASCIFQKGSPRFIRTLISGLTMQGTSVGYFEDCTNLLYGGGGASNMAGASATWIRGTINPGIGGGGASDPVTLIDATMNHTLGSGTYNYSGLVSGVQGNNADFVSGTLFALPSSNGSVHTRRAESADFTVTKGDQILGITSRSAAVAATLPDTSDNTLKPFIGQVFEFKDESYQANTYNITITPNGGNIDNGASLVISGDGGSARIYFDGTNYHSLI